MSKPPTIDAEDFDPDAYDIPLQRVLVEDTPAFGSGAPQPNTEMTCTEVEVPDFEQIQQYLELDLNSIGSLQTTAREKRQEAIAAKSWQAIREIGQQSSLKCQDASDETRFLDVVYNAVHSLEQQGGAPEEAEIFVNPETNRKVRNWMDQDERLRDTPTDVGTPSKVVNVAGFAFNFLETKHLETGELVMADTEIHAGPQHKPFVLVQNLPIGVEVRIEVNGESNNIVVNK